MFQRLDGRRALFGLNKLQNIFPGGQKHLFDKAVGLRQAMRGAAKARSHLRERTSQRKEGFFGKGFKQRESDHETAVARAAHDVVLVGGFVGLKLHLPADGVFKFFEVLAQGKGADACRTEKGGAQVLGLLVKGSVNPEFAAGKHNRLAKDIAQWKETVAERWDSISIVSKEGTMPSTGMETGVEYKIRVVIDEQGLNDAVGLEFVSITTDKNGEERISNVFPFKMVGHEGNLYTFEAIIEASEAGTYKTGIRMYPKNENLPHRQDFCYVRWI